MSTESVFTKCCVVTVGMESEGTSVIMHIVHVHVR